VSQDKFSKGLDKYKESLKLYSPPDVAILTQTIYAVESDKQGRIVSKYRADGEALEREGRIVDALAAYQKAYASYHVSVPQTDRMQLQVKIQEMTNRINGAKSWRAQGETQQKQGKVAEAITSYEQSLKLVPDKALEEHVKMLRVQVTKENDKKVSADKLWQEGTGLFNQGRPSDALTKFKESLTYWQDATRTKYVQDMEGRRSQAQTLRDQGAQLQQQNRLQDAIAKYSQSLQLWPDPKLQEHIAALQAKLKEAQDAEARKAQAKRSRDEGAGFQQQNRIREAINKYRESLTYWPDNQLDEHVRKLESSLTAVAPQPPVSPPTGSATIWTGTWKSDPRPGKEDVIFVLTQSGNRVTGTYKVDVIMPSAAGAQQKIAMTGKLEATGSGNKLNGIFRDREDKENTGTFDLTMAPAGNSFTAVARSGGTTENWTARRTSAGATVVPPADPPLSFDGTYGGAISGAASGSIQITVTGERTNGAINGTYQGDRFSGSWSGTLNKATGELQGTLKGDVSGYAFTGSITGRIQGSQANGTWNAKNQYGNPTGTWQATRGGSASPTSTGTGAGSASRGGTSVTAEITNKSSQNAHVFTEGETFSPSNRLAPGEKRKVSVQMTANGTVTFKAGRDGQVMATKRWDGEPGNPNRVPVVIFDDTNPFDKLTVVTGLR
jgi:tetratricopeptide (TPR) repeat protein